MEQIFWKISFLSISATWLILAVLVLRLILKKAPKWITCLLWCAVALRLVVPISIESAWSLTPDMSSVIDVSGLTERTEVWEQGDTADIVSPKGNATVGETESDKTDVNRQDFDKQDTVFAILPYIWASGVVSMLLYLLVSYLRLRSRVKTAVHLQENVWQSEYVDSPFVLGILRPQIYIPYHLNEEAYEYVLSHEEAHLSRKDHWIKAIAFLILGVHWFNPFVWLSYALLCKDIELACDECVTQKMNENEKKKYALALLNCSGKQHIFTACPISFGEVGVKERVVRVKAYKKPSVWITGLIVVACTIVVSCFVTSPKTGAAQDIETDGTDTTQEKAPDRAMEQLAEDEAIVNTDVHDVLSYELPEGLSETSYSKYTGFMGGCIFGPDVYEVKGNTSVPQEWKSAGMISRYYADNMLDWDGDLITEIHGFYNHSMMEQLGSLDGLCAPAFLIKGSHDLYTASEYEALEETDDIEVTSEYWYVFFAHPQDEVGYVVSLNAKNYTKEDVIEFAKTIQYLQ